MRPHRFVLGVSVLLCLTGCHHDPPQQLQQVEQSLTSWQATLQLLREDWAAGRVTDRYVRQVVKAANKDLEKQQKQLAQAPDDDPKRRELERQAQDVKSKAQRLLDNLNPSKPQAL